MVQKCKSSEFAESIFFLKILCIIFVNFMYYFRDSNVSVFHQSMHINFLPCSNLAPKKWKCIRKFCFLPYPEKNFQKKKKETIFFPREHWVNFILQKQIYSSPRLGRKRKTNCPRFFSFVFFFVCVPGRIKKQNSKQKNTPYFATYFL